MEEMAASSRKVSALCQSSISVDGTVVASAAGRLN